MVKADFVLTTDLMSLIADARLGVYEIISPPGAGGMGELYRARDTELERDVAIKILPDTFASDADRVARFTREAQTLASLNHPHIAQIYGLEHSSAGLRLRITAQLVNAADDVPGWSEKYNATIEDVFDIQEQVAREIARELAVKPSPRDSAAIRRRHNPLLLSTWASHLACWWRLVEAATSMRRSWRPLQNEGEQGVRTTAHNPASQVM